MGRHATPSLLSKVTRRKAKVIPAVAVAGALVAAPFIFHLGSSAPLATSGDIASAHQLTLSPHRDVHSGPTGKARSPRLASKHSHQAHRAGHQATSRYHASGHRAGSGRSAPPSHTPAPANSPSSKPASPVCDGTSGLLPENYGAIVTFLTTHGYTGLAAAGIAGNIYRESRGNPESVGTGGGGLIGWTPLPPGFVTGNPAADLQFQLGQLLVYNRQWAQFIPALNAATSARDAAFIYMSDFERPGIPAADIREGAAESVAAACHL